MRRLPELDGLRGIAILLVIAQHYVVGPMAGLPQAWIKTLLLPLRLAWSGVDLFFVLSGFLLGTILLTNREAPNYFRTFYLRRAFRILPLYCVLVLVAFVFHERLFGIARPSLLQYLTFTQNFWMAAAGALGSIPLAVTWSLAIEEQFYLVLPAIVRFVRPERLWSALAVCIVLAPAFRVALFATYGSKATVAAHVLLFTRLDTLAFGVLIAWLRYKGISIPTRGLVCAALLALVGLSFVSQGRSWSLVFLYDYVAVLYGVLLVLALQGSLPFLRNRFLAYTGVISYALYLFHQPVAFVIRGGDLSVQNRTDALAMVVSFVAVYALAAASWHFFEKPLIARGHRSVYGDVPGRPAASVLTSPAIRQ